MESAEPEVRRRHVEKTLDPLDHLAGCFVGKRNGKDMPGFDTVGDKIGDFRGQIAGLTTSGPGQNKRRPGDVFDSLPLFRIECCKIDNPFQSRTFLSLHQPAPGR